LSPQKPATWEQHNTPNIPSKRVPNIVEVIDVDAIDPTLSQEAPLDANKLSPYKPNHTSGMSSVDSTSRFERKMFSALGEELYGFDPQVDTTGMEPASPTVGAREFEPVGKRKRQGTLGGESPLSKKEKGSEDGDELEILQLRGD
jgi:hypothetical protein